MNPIKKLVLVKWSLDDSPVLSLKDQLKRSCRLHQVAAEIVDKNTPHFAAVHTLCDADYAVIWNGSCPLSTWAVDVRKSRGQHFKIIEVGWFKQNDYWHFDRKGIGGKSTLCEDLDKPSDEAWDKLKKKKEEYKFKVDSEIISELNLPDNYILCPYQVSSDVTVYYDSPYKFNNTFTDHVIKKFPNDPIVFKTHPKQTRDRLKTDRKDVYLVREGDFIDYTPNAKLVYGQTSTTLLEAAMLDVPVQAIGKCPLWYHQSSKSEIDKLLATMVDRQVDREITTDLFPYITSR